jgi:hypothetical protein
VNRAGLRGYCNSCRLSLKRAKLKREKWKMREGIYSMYRIGGSGRGRSLWMQGDIIEDMEGSEDSSLSDVRKGSEEDV